MYTIPRSTGDDLLNEEAGYKSTFAGPIFRDFAWHFKMESRGEKASLSHTINLCPFTFLLA